MKFPVKKIKQTFLLLCSIGLIACNDTPGNKQNKEITSPEIILECDINKNIIIPVTIKNKKYRFLVNTGASINVINEKVAPDISRYYSLTDFHSSYRHFFSTLQGSRGEVEESLYKYLKPIPFFIGSQEIKDEDIWLSIDLSLLSQSIGVDIDGIIGIESFRKFSWQVDNVKKRLIVTKDAPSTENYQTCDGYSDMLNSMPVINFRHDEIDNIAFMIDTGSDYGSISDDFSHYLKNKSYLKPASEQKTADVNGINLNTSSVILNGLKYNNMPLGDINFYENENKKYTMGTDFLSRFDRYAFIPSRMMFCYNAESINKINIPPIRHLNIRYIDKQIEFFYNNDIDLINTGLKNGDIIINVNGQEYAPDQIDELRDILANTAKGELKMTIRRDAQELTVQL